MIPLYGRMPVDKSTIITELPVKSAIFKDAESFTLDHDMKVRRYKQGTATRGGVSAKCLILDLLTFGGIRVTLQSSPRSSLTIMKIEFNPGVCLYGHNGRILTENEFLDALALLRSALTPLLANRADSHDLIPGLRRGSSAYWSYIEIPFHCQDLRGDILRAFRQSRHPSIRRGSRHWEDSMDHPGCRLQISIYRKAIEMAVRGKLERSELARFQHVLRLECRLRDKELTRYLGNGSNTTKINGTERLTCFRANDLFRALRAIFGQIQGVFQPDGPIKEIDTRGQLERIGYLLAQVARDDRNCRPFDDLLHQARRYLGVSETSFPKIREAGLTFLATKSALSFSDLFSDAAYLAQPPVISEQSERHICHEQSDICPDSLITAIYGSELSNLPRTEYPTYIR